MKTWCLALPLIAAFWFTNGTSTLPTPTSVVRFEPKGLEDRRYDHRSFITDEAHTRPDAIHFYNFGDAWGNDLNDSAVRWPEVKARGGQRVRLSFYYRFKKEQSVKLTASLSQYGHVTPDNYNVVGYSTTDKLLPNQPEWKHVEIEYTLDPKAEAVSPAFEMFYEGDPMLREDGWRGEAWIDDVKLTFLD